MSKKIIVILVAVFVVLAGLVTVLVINKDDSASSNQTQAPAAEQVEQRSQTANTISQLLSSSKSEQCKLNTTNEGVTVVGDMYFADNKLRADYTSTQNSKTTTGSMIILADKQYVWDVAGKKGVSFSFARDQIESESSNIKNQTGFDVTKQYDFRCQAWNIDETKFVPPTDVQFTDFTNLQNQLQQFQAN